MSCKSFVSQTLVSFHGLLILFPDFLSLINFCTSYAPYVISFIFFSTYCLPEGLAYSLRLCLIHRWIIVLVDNDLHSEMLFIPFSSGLQWSLQVIASWYPFSPCNFSSFIYFYWPIFNILYNMMLQLHFFYKCVVNDFHYRVTLYNFIIKDIVFHKYHYSMFSFRFCCLRR